jgi:hypothetical protein
MNLVELEFGDRMDEVAERQAFSELARRAVEIDSKVKEKQSPLRNWLLAGFEAATAPYDTFSDAYNLAYTELAVRARREEG